MNFRISDLDGHRRSPQDGFRTFHGRTINVVTAVQAERNYGWVWPNFNPISVPGPNQTLVDAEGAGSLQVALNGSGSYDSDGTVVSYDWTWPGGSASGATPTVTLPVGVTTVTLTVTDNRGAINQDSVTITISPQPNYVETAWMVMEVTAATSGIVRTIISEVECYNTAGQKITMSAHSYGMFDPTGDSTTVDNVASDWSDDADDLTDGSTSTSDTYAAYILDSASAGQKAYITMFINGSAQKIAEIRVTAGILDSSADAKPPLIKFYAMNYAPIRVIRQGQSPDAGWTLFGQIAWGAATPRYQIMTMGSKINVGALDTIPNTAFPQTVLDFAGTSAVYSGVLPVTYSLGAIGMPACTISRIAYGSTEDGGNYTLSRIVVLNHLGQVQSYWEGNMSLATDIPNAGNGKVYAANFTNQLVIPEGGGVGIWGTVGVQQSALSTYAPDGRKFYGCRGSSKTASTLFQGGAKPPRAKITIVL